MRGFFPSCPVFVAAALAVVAGPAAAQMQMTSGQAEIQTVNSAKQTLDEFSGLAIESIPPAMFGKAEGVAIFPDMIKGGFILGVNYGKGVLLVRRPDRTWSPPVMVTMGGGSLGFQAGVQSADIVLIFATPRSLNGILNGQKVTLGADASVALGPIGRQANAGTDARLGAEIYSYARSRGLFLGVSINGADLSVDNNANAMLYGRFGVTPADVPDVPPGKWVPDGFGRSAPGLGGLGAVGGAQHVEVRDAAHRPQVLDRLMGRAVFADVHAVVGEDVDHRLAHERGEAHAAVEKLSRLADLERAKAENDGKLVERLASMASPGFAVAAPHLGEAVEDLPGLLRLARGMAG
jgi:lipid-binding SYLF domain-containing protein